MSASEPNRRVVVLGGLASLAGVKSASAQTNAGAYHVVYTASTGCFGDNGAGATHSLDNLKALITRNIPLDYINTNFWSDDDRGRIAVDYERNPVPGTQIANVARGGNDKTSGSDLGKNLFRRYNLGPFSGDVVLVHVTDPSDRNKDRIVQRFNDTFKNDFVGDVVKAIEADRRQQQGVAR